MRGFFNILLIFIILIFVGLIYIHLPQAERKDSSIKVGLVFSTSVPYQLRQSLIKSVNASENIQILCINTGYRVYDNDTRLSSATDKIDQLLSIGADAVGLVYLDRKEQDECLKQLTGRKIPSFVISNTGNTDNSKADYLCYNDINLAMDTAGTYIYSISERKDSVAVLTDTKPEHEKMALAFSSRYCRMAKMDSMNIYAVNVPALPEKFSVLPPSESGVMETPGKINIPGLREIMNMGRMKSAAMCAYGVGDAFYYCDFCNYYFYNNDNCCCPKCGRPCPETLPVNLGNIRKEQNIDDAISKIERSKTETLYVIGDVAPVMAFRRLKLDAHKNVKMVATGSELLTLMAINSGTVTANVEPDWRGMARNFYIAIDNHFGKKLNPEKAPVSYMVKDFRYYSDNSPVELPPGKGARENIREQK